MSTILQSTTFWVVVLAAAGIGIFLLWHQKTPEGWGFRDVLKNPEFWDHAEDQFEAMEESEKAAEKWNDKKVAQATSEFIFEATTKNDNWIEYRILTHLGSRTHETILKILNDEGNDARLVKPTGEDFVPEAPLNRACALLGDEPPAAAISALARFLDHPNEDIRADVAGVIARTGHDDMIPHVKSFLQDQEEAVRSNTLSNLLLAIQYESMSERCKQELYGDVEALLNDQSVADEAAESLCLMDKGRTVKLFLSPKVLSIDCQFLLEALRALSEAKVLVPQESLDKLLQDLQITELEYPLDDALGETLVLISRHKNPKDLVRISPFLDHQNEDVATGAANALLELHELSDYHIRLFDKEEKHGLSSLSTCQRHCRAVSLFDSEVCNGGFDQYFVNSFADEWHDTQAGLEAIGFSERLQIFRQAINKFGRNGPSTDRDKRQVKLAKISQGDESAFETIDSRYFDCPEVLDVFLARYVIENADSFR